MALIPMDPAITRKLLEGYEDELTPLAEAREQFYQNQDCPHCAGADFTRIASQQGLFRGNDPLPRYQLECNHCGCVFDPFSGIVIKLGNLAEALEPAIPILEGPDD